MPDMANRASDFLPFTITSTLSRCEPSSSNKGLGDLTCSSNNAIINHYSTKITTTQKSQPAGGNKTGTTTGAPINILGKSAGGDGDVLDGNQEDQKKCMLSGWKSRESERNKVRLRDGDGYRMRAAALCIKGTGNETLVLLVSGGKDGGKWVVPGGGIEKDECAEEAAHRELMEEAGVRATTLKAIGMFQDDVRKHRTQVFLMEVSEELETWEENEYGRQRIWMNYLESKDKVKQSHRPILDALMR